MQVRAAFNTMNSLVTGVVHPMGRVLDTVIGAVGNLTGSREWLVVILAGIVGLFIGSFLNVVVYRAPLGLSVSSPRSFCPTCDRQLVWWENVPVVSWLALRGRCHTCHEPISARYPLVEATTAVAFAFVAWGWHGSLITAGYCVLAATAISVGLIEYGGHRSPLVSRSHRGDDRRGARPCRRRMARPLVGTRMVPRRIHGRPPGVGRAP